MNLKQWAQDHKKYIDQQIAYGGFTAAGTLAAVAGASRPVDLAVAAAAGAGVQLWKTRVELANAPGTGASPGTAAGPEAAPQPAQEARPERRTENRQQHEEESRRKGPHHGHGPRY